MFYRTLSLHAFCQAAKANASFYEMNVVLSMRSFTEEERGPNHLFFMTIPAIKMFRRLMVPKNYWLVKRLFWPVFLAPNKHLGV